MPPGCQLRLLSDSTWRVSAGGVFFSSASLLSLGCDGVLQDARCRWWRGGAFVWVWLSFLCAIKSAWFGETVDFLIQSLTTEHTFMTNCIILALRSEHLLFLLSLMVVSPFLRNKVCVRAHLYTRTRFPAALLSGLDISYRFSYINAVWCPVGRSTQCEGWGLSKQLVQRLTTSANRSSINKRNDNRLWGNMLT